MEARVAKLESLAEKTGERLTAIERDVAVIKTELQNMKANFASKADVSDASNKIIMWVVTAILLAQVLPPLLRKFGIGP
jgi:hypothetical protein